jgi:hypothetical protein
MKASIAMDTIVASGLSCATQGSVERRDGDFRDNTYNRYSYLDEADMNS